MMQFQVSNIETLALGYHYDRSFQNFQFYFFMGLPLNFIFNLSEAHFSLKQAMTRMERLYFTCGIRIWDHCIVGRGVPFVVVY